MLVAVHHPVLRGCAPVGCPLVHICLAGHVPSRIGGLQPDFSHALLPTPAASFWAGPDQNGTHQNQETDP
jgi:hypothetical protein